jgi:hypothetical protein
MSTRSQKLEIQAEQVEKEYGGSQTISCMDTKMALDQGKPCCIPPIILNFSFNPYNYVLLDCAFKFIGIERHPRCIMFTFLVTLDFLVSNFKTLACC